MRVPKLNQRSRDRRSRFVVAATRMVDSPYLFLLPSHYDVFNRTDHPKRVLNAV